MSGLEVNVNSDDGDSAKITVSDRVHAMVWVTKYRWVWLTLIILAVFGIAFVVGYAVGMTIHMSADEELLPQHYNADISRAVQDRIKAADIDSYLKIFTKTPHITGTPANEEIGAYVAARWREAGLTVRYHNYTNVLMQYPKADSPNAVEIVENSVNYFHSNNTGLYYNAYSAVGTAEGKLVYVNYGTPADFATLKATIGCGQNNQKFVAIARYGSRRNIVKNAEEWCPEASSPIVALLLFPDPADYAPQPEKIWPNGVYLRGTDAFFGTVYSGSGDPLTPGVPSLDTVLREDQPPMPFTRLLVQPISYDDARELMKDMTGSSPAGWKGNLTVPYNTGPGYASFPNRQVSVNIIAESSNKRPVKNILGVIPGNAEEDRYVIVGAHYDSWTNGANDASSATAVVTLLGIALQQQVKQGWKPRRSIILVHWDGEQFTKSGSQEFIDQFGVEVHRRTVAYIDLDEIVNGLHVFHARGVPLLSQVMYDATKTFDFPGIQGSSVYDVWRQRSSLDVLGNPTVHAAAVNGDLWSFWDQYGVPYITPFFNAEGNGVPFRYSLLDTYEMVQKYVDPGFQFHQLCGRIVADTVLRLSDYSILPYSFVPLSQNLLDHFNRTVTHHKTLIESDTQTYALINHLRGTMNEFVSAAYAFEKMTSEQWNVLSDNKLRVLNDKIQLVAQLFVSQYNAAFRGITSLMYGVDSKNDLTVLTLPGFSKALDQWQAATDQTAKEQGRLMTQREVSILFVAFHQATAQLRSQSLFETY